MINFINEDELLLKMKELIKIKKLLEMEGLGFPSVDILHTNLLKNEYNKVVGCHFAATFMQICETLPGNGDFIANYYQNRVCHGILRGNFPSKVIDYIPVKSAKVADEFYRWLFDPETSPFKIVSGKIRVLEKNGLTRAVYFEFEKSFDYLDRAQKLNFIHFYRMITGHRIHMLWPYLRNVCGYSIEEAAAVAPYFQVEGNMLDGMLDGSFKLIFNTDQMHSAAYVHGMYDLIEKAAHYDPATIMIGEKIFGVPLSSAKTNYILSTLHRPFLAKKLFKKFQIPVDEAYAANQPHSFWKLLKDKLQRRVKRVNKMMKKKDEKELQRRVKRVNKMMKKKDEKVKNEG